jgi:hypothetical protein
MLSIMAGWMVFERAPFLKLVDATHESWEKRREPRSRTPSHQTDITDMCDMFLALPYSGAWFLLVLAGRQAGGWAY